MMEAAYSVRQERTLAQVRLSLLALAAIAVAGLCAALLMLGSYVLAAGVVLGFAGLAALVRWPIIGLYGTFAGALLFDHHRLAAVNLPSGYIPLWDTLAGFQPAGLILVTSFGLFLLQRLHRGERPILRGGRLLAPCLAFFGLLLYGVLRGLTYYDGLLPRSFQLNIAMIEFGSLIYLPVVYVMAHNMIETPRQVRALTWVMIVALGLKALQSTWTVARLGAGVFDLNEIASHEDSLFMAMLLVLGVGLWFCHGDRLQRWVVLGMSPFLLLQIVANQRRAAFISLAIGLIVAGVMLLSDQRIRANVIRISIVFAVLLAGYVAVFWNATGPAAEPVYLVRSLLSRSDSADGASNDWRAMERVNIEETIDRSPLLGIGFGRQYRFWIEEPSLDPTGFTYWRFVSHNVIYWLWMKLGVIGFAAFWYLLGSVVLLGTLTFRRLVDPNLRALVLMVVALVAMQATFSYGDIGLASGRNMVLLGALFGVLATIDRWLGRATISERTDAASAEPARTVGAAWTH